MPSERTSYADRTLAAYATHAPAAIANWGRHGTPSRWLKRFARMCPPGARVLDYGCGVGTDLAWLHRRGLRVNGLDGTPAFVREARRRCPGAGIRMARFESVRLPSEAYDGIWCRAALLHVPPEALPGQVARLRRALRPGGVLGLTLAWGRSRAFTPSTDWMPDRYIAAYSKSEAAALVRRGWRLDAIEVRSHDGRQGRWIHLLITRTP